MGDILRALFSGVMVGLITLTFLAANIPGNVCKQGKDAKAQCEATLPRDQHCVITAIPESE